MWKMKMPIEPRLILGDCLEAMRNMADNSVDAVVTDPPAGIAFMGKHWDKDKGGRAEWVAWMESIAREAWRVIKPGGHALVWSIPRTSHWTGWAWESAGWECRDKIYHVFGSGFPKSLSIGKAIDKAAGGGKGSCGCANFCRWYI
jgi:site-specific DNA-methyltransferase (adenine-specific)